MTSTLVRRGLRAALPALLLAAVASFAGARPALAGAPGCFTQPGDDAGVAAVRAAALAQCDCDGAASHHGFVECLRSVADNAVRAGTIRRTCFKNIVRPLETSTCGRPGAVVCCLIGPRGGETCKVRATSDACRPAKGGSAYLGATDFCLTGCTAP